MTAFLEIDPDAPHETPCNEWHGLVSNTSKDQHAALEHYHCHGCAWMNSFTGSDVCDCNGYCICLRTEGCPCIGVREPAPEAVPEVV
jgi:hypothetical protein